MSNQHGVTWIILTQSFVSVAHIKFVHIIFTFFYKFRKGLLNWETLFL